MELQARFLHLACVQKMLLDYLASKPEEFSTLSERRKQKNPMTETSCCLVLPNCNTIGNLDDSSAVEENSQEGAAHSDVERNEIANDGSNK